MRTNIDLDDELVRQARELTGIATKKELVHAGLRELIRARRRRKLSDLVGKVRLIDEFDPKAHDPVLRDVAGSLPAS